MPIQAYIAGPLFNEGERWFDEQVEQCASEADFSTFLPHRDGKEGKMKGPENLSMIFKEDREAIDASDIVIANLNGIMVDDGTSWEIGYAYARGKHIVGIYTDWRLSFKYQTVNLMIECSLNKLVGSMDELRAYLKEYADNLKC